MSTATASGLDDVVVVTTELSHVDGVHGILVIRGQSVEAITERGGFEEVCGLLWTGAWPDADMREALRRTMASARMEAYATLALLGDALRARDIMDGLRAALAHIRVRGDASDRLRLTAAIPVFAAAWARRQLGLKPVAPEPGLRHAADILHMLTGAPPAREHSIALDAYLCCVVDHGMNASTFTARVVASTGSDIVSAVVAALGALKGPLHGGAPGPVLDMLDAIRSPGAARGWLEAELKAGRRIVGMGHRIYHARDPRAAALERAARKLGDTGGVTEKLALARRVEHEAEQLLAERYPHRRLSANVEFYTAVLLDAVGIPRTLFTPMFAASRVAGWCAHVDEQRAVGRLIRPASAYTGRWPTAV